MKIPVLLVAVALLGGSELGAQAAAQAPQQPMGFFVTSTGIGDGANLGGLDGADRHCQSLAGEAGAGNQLIN